MEKPYWIIMRMGWKWE